MNTSPHLPHWVTIGHCGVTTCDVSPDRPTTTHDQEATVSATELTTLYPLIDAWRHAGHGVALATVVAVAGSAPRPVGATMAVSSGGDLAGSVSGGCVETAVFEEAQEVLRTRVPKLVHYGISDEMAWDVGLACGGAIDVFIEPIDVEGPGTR